jgi:hypothetical protein
MAPTIISPKGFRVNAHVFDSPEIQGALARRVYSETEICFNIGALNVTEILALCGGARFPFLVFAGVD